MYHARVTLRIGRLVDHVNTNFSLEEKCWVRGNEGEKFPRIS